MAAGGRRPGSGRKKKAEKYKGAINRAEKQIVDKLPQLIENEMALADGILVEDAETRIVYRTPPDRAANEYLINRIMGKPTEKKEITGENGDAINLQTTIIIGGEELDDNDTTSDKPEML